MLNCSDDGLDWGVINRTLVVLHRLDVAPVVVVVVEGAVGLVFHFMAVAQVKWCLLCSALVLDFVTDGHLMSDASPVSVVFVMP